MESSELLPNLGPGMLLGLEMPLHPQHLPQHHNPDSNPHQQRYPRYQQMLAFASDDTNLVRQPPHSVKQTPYPNYTTKAKQPQQQNQQLGLSDEDEPGFTADDGSGDGRKRVSPWQRVKWTDDMVRLLIVVVFYTGDDGCPEGNKKKSSAVLQKKGKWKLVSKTMMQKGFCVSPQQCEDKFNDLNKRYKRVTDILGKGTACSVVENQSLLDTMDQLSPKMKEEARKLLNSKHLFFREMCAYHNSAHQSTEANQQQQQHPQLPQQHCFHPLVGAQITNSRSRMVREGMHEGEDENEENEEDDEEDNDIDEDSEDEEEDVGGNGKCLDEHSRVHEDGDINDEFPPKKKQRNMLSSPSLSPSIQQLNCEVTSVLQDGTKSPWEQRQWITKRSMQLEEQQVSYQCQAFELEKQRMKWAKFSWKKEREMERMKLHNEQTRLENERMVLILRQRELELLELDFHQQQQRPSTQTLDRSG